jgi:small subunit ribosomal protein S9
MAIKKAKKDESAIKSVPKNDAVNVAKNEEVEASVYFYGIGKRKTSIAQIKAYPSSKNQSEIIVNEKKVEDYFTISRLADVIKSPLVVAGQDKKFSIIIKVSGGGINSQAEAIRLGISRALVESDATLKKPLRDKGFMTRDARKVERKKPGLRKARRAPQWAKR